MIQPKSVISFSVFLFFTGFSVFGGDGGDSLPGNLAWELGFGPGLMAEEQQFSFSDGFSYSGSTRVWYPLALNGKIGYQIAPDFALFINNTANIVWPSRTLTINNSAGLESRFTMPMQKRPGYAGFGIAYDARLFPLALNWAKHFNQNGISISGRVGILCTPHFGVEVDIAGFFQWHRGHTDINTYQEVVNYTETHYGFITSLRVMWTRYKGKTSS